MITVDQFTACYCSAVILMHFKHLFFYSLNTGVCARWLRWCIHDVRADPPTLPARNCKTLNFDEKLIRCHFHKYRFQFCLLIWFFIFLCGKLAYIGLQCQPHWSHDTIDVSLLSHLKWRIFFLFSFFLFIFYNLYLVFFL